MDNIHGSGPIQPNIPSSEKGSTSKSSDAQRIQDLLERAPSVLHAFTKQLSNALLPLQEKKQGLESTLKGGACTRHGLREAPRKRPLRQPGVDSGGKTTTRPPSRTEDLTLQGRENLESTTLTAESAYRDD